VKPDWFTNLADYQRFMIGCSNACSKPLSCLKNVANVRKYFYLFHFYAKKFIIFQQSDAKKRPQQLP
jgi:hypothetical protein